MAHLSIVVRKEKLISSAS